MSVQLDLFDGSERQLRLEKAIDEVRRRFGADAMGRAEDLEEGPNTT